MRLTSAAALCAVVAAPLLLERAAAQSPPATLAVKPDLVIAARQSAFALSGGTFTGMHEAVKRGDEVKPWADFAHELSVWAGVIPTMFPPGTEKGLDTKALPTVWSDPGGFARAAGAYADAAKKLEAAARANDKAGFAVAFKETGKACGACHKKVSAEGLEVK